MGERQARYLDPADRSTGPCWQVNECPAEWRAQCPVWQYEVGYGCWELGGTYCRGSTLSKRSEKAKLCRQCAVFQSTLVAPKK